MSNSNIDQNIEASNVSHSNHPMRETLASYYREGDVFERDQSYYNQLLENPRRDRSS